METCFRQICSFSEKKVSFVCCHCFSPFVIPSVFASSFSYIQFQPKVFNPQLISQKTTTSLDNLLKFLKDPRVSQKYNNDGDPEDLENELKQNEGEYLEKSEELTLSELSELMKLAASRARSRSMLLSICQGCFYWTIF